MGRRRTAAHNVQPINPDVTELDLRFERESTPLPRSLEIEAIVQLGRERADLSPAHPASAVLYVAVRLLEELAAERGILPIDRTALRAPVPAAPPAADPRSRMERFVDTIEDTCERFLAEGAHPPNLAGALRGEAHRIERKYGGK